MIDMDKVSLSHPPMQSKILADGRQMTWQEFGDPEGKAALYFHGGGSLSFEAGIFHREAAARNIRLISTNRPGAAGSSLRPGRPAAAYADDLTELLDGLGIRDFACFGESNGGMMTMAIASAMADRVLGGIPINPTVPWFDPIARRVSPCAVGFAYRLMKFAPGVIVSLSERSKRNLRGMKAKASAGRTAAFDPGDLIGPPPGTEDDVANIHWRMSEGSGRDALFAELKWASAPWGFDHYAIPVPLDLFCGVHDAQAPFALVLADMNPDARFHYFPYGHQGFAHPDARRRILDVVDRYFRR